MGIRPVSRIKELPIFLTPTVLFIVKRIRRIEYFYLRKVFKDAQYIVSILLVLGLEFTSWIETGFLFNFSQPERSIIQANFWIKRQTGDIECKNDLFIEPQ